MANRGRPTDNGTPRGTPLSVRLHATEAELLREAAASKCMTVSEFIRYYATGAARGVIYEREASKWDTRGYDDGYKRGFEAGREALLDEQAIDAGID